MKPSQPDEPNAPRTRFQRWIGAGVAAIGVFLMIADNWPVESAIGERLDRLARPTLKRLGLNQEWDMFETIPYFERMSTVLVLSNTPALGTVPMNNVHLGPVLPGFREAPYYCESFFRRIRLSQWDRYEKAYMQSARRNLQARGEPPGAIVWREATSHRLRSLDEIREDGRVSDVATNRSIMYRIGP